MMITNQLIPPISNAAAWLAVQADLPLGIP
jgi:hypothetical protein